MKITLFTSNHSRHNYFINLLSNLSSELFVIQESRPILPAHINENLSSSNIIKNYFSKVTKAQKLLFGDGNIEKKNKNINLLLLKSGDLAKHSLSSLKNFLNSDIYIVFGSSYIKGELVDFLIKKKTINIHMGVSPYYRGAACNFWALYDNNPHLVGATIHLLSKGLDSGPILYHAMSELRNDPFVYTMSTVKSALHSVIERIKNKKIFDYKPVPQDKSKEIRYSKKIHFNEEIVNQFFKKKIDLKNEFKLELLKDPFFLK